MRLRTYIALISGLLVILILVVIATQTRRILDRGFHELGASDVTRAQAVVKAVIKSKRDNLTSFKKLIAADEEITNAFRHHQLLPKLQELKALGTFDFVDFIFPNGTSAFGNEKRFGSAAHIEEKMDAERFSVVKMDGNLMLVSFCTKRQKEIGILVLGYRLTGPFVPRQ